MNSLVGTHQLRFNKAASVAFATAIVMILCLPSVWMMRSIPPLWKDIDAYYQVTEPPNLATILQYAPLYCFSARVPLYIGAAWDALRAGASLPGASFFLRPTLTDTGVWLLLLAQHAGVICASYLVIANATRVLLFRAVLAGIWALNPLLYAFAHTVASEALSAILLLLVAANGLRVLRRLTSVRRWTWLGVLVALSILTRHVNGVVAALLPIALIASVGLQAIRHRRPGRREIRCVAVAVIVSMLAIAAADGALRATSWAAGIDFHRRVGFSFLFRLKFFTTLSPADRERVLQRAAAHARTSAVQPELEALRAMPSDERTFRALDLLARIREALPPDTAASLDATDRVLNETARAFLIAPSAPYLRAVATDLVRAQRTTIPMIVGHLLQSTVMSYDPVRMPQLTHLSTFRSRDLRYLLTHTYKRRYFAVWKRCTHLRLLIAVLIAVAFCARTYARATAYAAALVVVGFLSVLGNALVNEFQPRYTLPMWEFTLVALTVLLPPTFLKLRRLVRLWR